MAPILLDLISQYPVLTALASYLSTVDLLHLGMTCRDYQAFILSPTQVFEALRRDCLCDGHGLRRRLDLDSRYKRSNYRGIIREDEELEVKLFATRCDEAGALPCLGCGINVCEECREYPRPPARPLYNDRRPHLNWNGLSENVFCLCAPCDTKLEVQLRGRFLNELCDCDRYRRWICLKCVREEETWAWDYYNQYTIREVDDVMPGHMIGGDTKFMRDGETHVLFHCTCDALVPMDARPRCSWCKRKHRPESEWDTEMREIQAIPTDDDGTYPFYDIHAVYAESYPSLAYDGPIYQAPLTDDNNR
ncbi:hypothetical protein F4821DRAFT_224952 [Hypoxylon rubiginosum]|uniref:Uncharacterized protein n=1 Tax=Hypoxylon rubiginosum TaxID=110542 RepID=A0ACC0DHC5_9PEZI|nr:hypothetical protein F4821DRAFT_224952 [Hypoxylon rubiginosum]